MHLQTGKILICLIIFCITATAATFAAEFNDQQKSEIESIIYDYLVNNPEVIEEAQEELDRRKEEEARIRAEKLTSDKDGLLFASENQSVIGNPNGDITLVEFFDYNCGFCKRSLADILKIIENDDQIKVVLKEFPILGEESYRAAQISVAANIIDSEKYPKFHERLMLTRKRVDASLALNVAKKVGYDVEAIDNMIESPTIVTAIQEVYQLAENLSLSGTPAFVLGDEVIRGAIEYDKLTEKIDSLRRCGTTTCTW